MNTFLNSLLTAVIFMAHASAPVSAQKGATPAPLHMGPSCQFSVTGFCFGDTTVFINQTIRVMAPEWEITDTTGIIYTSIDTNIKFLFPYAGTFSVTVKANNGHPDSLTKILVVDSVTKASFTFQQCTQSFVNMSSCATGFSWDFGDGNTSTAPYPVHLYSDTGTYTVKLIAYNGVASDTLTQNITVLSIGFATAQFTYYQSNDTVYFFGDTLAQNYSWDFGDQNFSTQQNPFNVYADTGDYLIVLIVNNYCGMYFYSQTIHVFPPASVPSLLNNTGQGLSVFPNPFEESTTIQVPGSKIIKAHIRLFDVFGTEMLSRSILNADSFILTKGSLKKGLFFIEFTTENSGVYRSKVVVR